MGEGESRKGHPGCGAYRGLEDYWELARQRGKGILGRNNSMIRA